jgi:EmrB/QacA subfamily drug resistance transporter
MASILDASPTASHRTRRDQRLTMVAVSLALFVIFLDNTIVNVALPTIQRDLTTTPDVLEWVVNAYVVTFAGLVVAAGRLGDRFGRRRLFLAGLGVFATASAAGALATTSTVLIGARSMQGVGAAMLAPLSLSLLVDAFPRRSLPAAVGMWAGVSGLGLAVGPLVGGLLAEHAGWHSVFWVNVPIAAIAAAVTWQGVPAYRPSRALPVNMLGAFTASAALLSIVAGLSRTVRHPWSDPLTVALLATGICLVAAFAVVQRRTQQPLLPRSATADRRTLAASLVIALASFSLFGTLWYLTLYLQNIARYDAIAAGVRTLPLTISTLFIAPIAGKVAARRGPVPVLAAGLFLAMVAFVALTQLTTTTGYPFLAGALLTLGTGLALVLPTAVAVTLDGVNPDNAGVTAGLTTMARQLGGALGLAVLVSVGSHSATAAVEHALPGQAGVAELAAGGEVTAVGHLGGSASEVVAVGAFLHGMHLVMWLAAAAAALASTALVPLGRDRTAAKTEQDADRHD